MADWMNKYLDTVRVQIRWKLARPVVLRELESHLQDQYEACLADGMTKDEAQAEALRQMGDPVAVGKELDRVHRPKGSWEIVAIVAVLVATSLSLGVFVFYENSTWSLDHWLWTPLQAITIGGVVCFLLSRLDMNTLAKRSGYLYLVGLILMAGLIGLGDSWICGIHYWGHYMGLLLPLAYGGAVYALRGKGGKGLVLSLVVLIPLLILAYLSNSLGPLLGLCISAAVMLLAANGHGAFGLKKRRNAAAILTVTGTMVLGYLCVTWERLAAVLRPLSYGLEENFQRFYVQGLLANSRMIGAGSAFRFAGRDHEISPDTLLVDAVVSTDFLLAGVSYLCGWAVALALLAAVVGLLVLLLRRGLKQRTLWGKLVSCAVIVPLMLQMAGYVLVNLGFPVSSFELPFLSYGGAYKVIDLALLGVLLGVFRCRTILREEQRQVCA